MRVELLEDRRLLATFTVTSTLDAGEGSLRAALALANAAADADVIEFAPALFESGPKTIQLHSQLDIDHDLAIVGPGSPVLALRVVGASRVFDIDGGAASADKNVSISGITMTGGNVTGAANVGGGIRSKENLTLVDSVVNGCTSAATGGGIWQYGGTLSLSACTISGNTGLRGGGFYAYGATVTVDGCSVYQNTATAGVQISGGGIAVFGGNLTITNSTLSYNVANDQGGGILNFGAALVIRHSTITKNRNDANNSGFGQGGGLFTNNGATLEHTIVAGNFRGSGTTRDDVGGSATAFYSLIGDSTGATITNIGNSSLVGTGAVPIDPLLVLDDLHDNGGPTHTHALLPGSPALNAGDPLAAPNVGTTPAVDQRGGGMTRVHGGRIDIGAVEAQPRTLVVDTTTDIVNGNYTAGQFSLREAVARANANAGPDVINFAPALSGQTITLGGTALQPTDAVSIDATALPQNVTIDANHQSIVVHILTVTGDFRLAGVTLTRGHSNSLFGSAILSPTEGHLELWRTVINNNSLIGVGPSGPGIVYSHGNITLVDSTVSGNTVIGLASLGGLISGRNDVTLIDSEVVGVADLNTGNVQGILAGGRVVMNRSAVHHVFRGRGVFAIGAVDLTESTINDNGGGGVFSQNDVTVTRSTISGNYGDNGAGIMASRAVTLIQSTVTDNKSLGAGQRGGGVYQSNTAEDHPFTIVNSIVAGNLAQGGVDPDIVKDPQTTLMADYSLIGVTPAGGIVGVGNVTGVPPMLGPLTDNGGPTPTHALLPGSPAHNGGYPDAAFSPSEFDQRGAPFTLVLDGRLDMGAVESAISADFDFDGDVDGNDFLIWQRGLGATGEAATNAAGNADVDNDIDGVDFAVWRSSFGNGATAAEQLAKPAVAPHVLMPARLIDAAMAYEQLSEVAPRRSFRPRGRGR